MATLFVLDEVTRSLRLDADLVFIFHSSAESCTR